VANAVASFEQPERQQLTVTGSQAIAALTPEAAFTTWREPSALRIGDVTEVFPEVDAFTLMVTAMSERVLGHEAWVVPTAQSRAAAAILDRVAALPSSE
jgi:aminoglycoside phosphotransferase